jgi:hypothetical protein
VTFTPPAPAANTQCGSAAGAQTSTLSIFDNDPKSPQVLALSGMAMDYCLIPPGAISATVPSGSAGQFQLDAQSAGFAGTVALTCTAAVPEGACTILPATVTLTAAGAPVPFQVSVTTTARPAGSLVGIFDNFRIVPTEKLSGVSVRAFGLLILAMLLWPSGARRHRTGTLRALETCVLAVVISLGLAACSGGSQTAVAATGTAAGTYPITITGTTTAGATRTLGLTLTVQ